MKILTWDSALLPHGRLDSAPMLLGREVALNTYGTNSLTRNFMSM